MISGIALIIAPGAAVKWPELIYKNDTERKVPVAVSREVKAFLLEMRQQPLDHRVLFHHSLISQCSFDTVCDHRLENFTRCDRVIVRCTWEAIPQAVVLHIIELLTCLMLYGVFSYKAES